MDNFPSECGDKYFTDNNYTDVTHCSAITPHSCQTPDLKYAISEVKLIPPTYGLKNITSHKISKQNILNSSKNETYSPLVFVTYFSNFFSYFQYEYDY